MESSGRGGAGLRLNNPVITLPIGQTTADGLRCLHWTDERLCFPPEGVFGIGRGGRKVELRMAEDLSRSFRDAVVRTAEVQYEAG